MRTEAGLEVERLDGGAVVRLTLARPERGNSLTRALLADLERAVLDLPAGGARAAILGGAGEKAFSTGYDIDALREEVERIGDAPGGEAATLAWLAGAEAVAGGLPGDALRAHPLERALEAVAASPVPFVAAVRGSATGAGFELACACDLRVAGRSARFLMPPARLGVLYSATGIARVLSLVGAGAAREIFLLAEPVDAARAESLGLVTRLVEDAALADEALAVARRLAENAPRSISGTKRIIGRILELRLDRAALDEISALRAAAFRSADFAEGALAFLEKRKPRFEGR